MSHQKWLVKNILPSHGLNLLYGPPGCGKSFIALDIAMCVASGREWMGHEVEQKPVLYFAVEGHSSEHGNRICAALAHYGIPKGTSDLQGNRGKTPGVHVGTAWRMSWASRGV